MNLIIKIIILKIIARKIVIWFVYIAIEKLLFLKKEKLEACSEM